MDPTPKRQHDHKYLESDSGSPGTARNAPHTFIGINAPSGSANQEERAKFKGLVTGLEITKSTSPSLWRKNPKKLLLTTRIESTDESMDESMDGSMDESMDGSMDEGTNIS
ncbi:hypothetical protein S7711_11149 [Stachybotrys chartarum IBT 7711]|uniref:Uncharacterized protein n=1 Tax=Stachybotrys chartarum (strain CBS 109288 / IBT 7711) TaxID=1280523 RepID=A0A084AFN3_STACB|nr:hypothetical protein S7711_11149 [Stachybotrys chartarum IBT 7711]